MNVGEEEVADVDIQSNNYSLSSHLMTGDLND
jgi:hypothetical protein